MVNYLIILELINNSDPKGLQELYNSYGKKFYGYAIRKWNLSKDDAWDVVYQTLETLILKLPKYSFESQSHFNNFLYKVFINFLRQHFRTQRAKQSEIEYVNVDAESNEDGQPSGLRLEIDKKIFNEYYQSESIESPEMLALNEALEKLPSDDKDLLLLRAQNFSYEEIAKLLSGNNNPNNLKVKYHRAKNKLLELLQIEKLKTETT